VLSAACLALLLGTATPAAPGDGIHWTQLREGLTRGQVADLLGQPLMRNASRGQERWVYDAGCDVQFENGAVKWWTAPRTITPAAPAVSHRAPAPARGRT